MFISSDTQQDLQVRKWKTSYGQYRNCFIGDLPGDFLRVKLISHSDKTNNQSTVRISFLFLSQIYSLICQ